MGSYKLPNSDDIGGFAIETEVVQMPTWMNYDENTQTFSVDPGATTENEIGSYVIKVKLSNSGGGEAIYTFTVSVEAPIIDLFVEEDEEEVDYSPIPTVDKVTERGLITLKWDRPIKIPRNLTFV